VLFLPKTNKRCCFAFPTLISPYCLVYLVALLSFGCLCLLYLFPFTPLFHALCFAFALSSRCRCLFSLVPTARWHFALRFALFALRFLFRIIALSLLIFTCAHRSLALCFALRFICIAISVSDNITIVTALLAPLSDFSAFRVGQYFFAMLRFFS